MATIKDYLESCKNIKATEDMIVFNKLINHALLGKELTNDLIKVLWLVEDVLFDIKETMLDHPVTMLSVRNALIEIKKIKGEQNE